MGTCAVWAIAAIMALLAASLSANVLQGAARASASLEPAAASSPPAPSAEGDHAPRANLIPESPQLARAYARLAQKWADQARKSFAPQLHRIQTPHFTIFSSWKPSADSWLRRTCERIYREMCVQFDFPAGKDVWLGRCPLYVFAKKKQYDKFTSGVDKAHYLGAGGYCATCRDGFVYIVINHCINRSAFYELLVHETTHGFLARYRSSRPINAWINEGLAEYMTARLAPWSAAVKRNVLAGRMALRTGRNLSHIFKKVRLTAFDYGLAQSLVRFLILRDRKAFVRFIQELKDGVGESKALKDCFHLTHAELLKQWRAEARRELGRR